MPRRITDLTIFEVSAVDKGAGENCRVMLSKRDEPTGAEMLTNEVVSKALRAASAADLPDCIEKLFDAGFDPTKVIVDLLNSRIVKKDADRNEHSSYLASFTGVNPRDPVGKAILAVWHENDQRLSGIAFAKRRKPVARADAGDGTKPKMEVDHGDDSATSDFDKLVDAHMAATKCAKPQAVAATMKTAAGNAAYQADRDQRLAKMAQC